MAHHHRSVSGSSSSSGLHFPGSSPFGDTTFTKVFVGGLAWETNSDALRRHFEPFGEIFEAAVISDKNTGRSKGYGFVTFRDPESARRACADPSPIIDGRRANCNLASMRPRLAPPHAHSRSVGQHGNVPVPREASVGGSIYNQPVPYGFQQGFTYPPFGYTAYGQEFVYPQNIYNPAMAQQYIQVHGVPGTVNTTIFPFGQLGMPYVSGHGYAQGYTMPGHHYVQLTGPNVTGVTALPLVQAPYNAAHIPAQPQFILSAHSPQFAHSGGSEQAAG
ncbi:putative RNA-binding protein SEB4 (RRM superfamily) protein [Dioscorea alata]|uniref:RNA-binding protein SEB4 (RRM superfamily) protein n=2 Tax=Dioscorea alata TaxID=55571 RepID=A0ACB7W9M9_DIOAL|nr:putative RNA-binding protein SEB4 (RRM superfamily) protein [Dioscorea alata]KAH7684379.1 putative RNA-binding protein SEB4 (RRM superfamily) protein [Dioscorea alata]